MLYRLHLTYDETIDNLVLKLITTTTIGYTLPPGFFEVTDINFMLESLLPEEVKVNNTVDDVRLR